LQNEKEKLKVKKFLKERQYSAFLDIATKMVKIKYSKMSIKAVLPLIRKTLFSTNLKKKFLVKT
jgi:hypothetical protein